MNAPLTAPLTVVSITLNFNPEHPTNREVSVERFTYDETKLKVTVCTTETLTSMFSSPKSFFGENDPALPQPIKFDVQEINFTGGKISDNRGAKIFIPAAIENWILRQGMKPTIRGLKDEDYNLFSHFAANYKITIL